MPDKILNEKTLLSMASKKTRLSYKVFYMANDPRYISPPRKLLISYLCAITVILSVFISLLLYGGVMAYIAIPLLIFVCYVFFIFTRVWRCYKYSLFYPIAALVLSVAFAFLVRYLINKI